MPDRADTPRAVWVALLWSYVALIAGLLVVGLVVAVSAAALGSISLVTGSTPVIDSIVAIARVGAWTAAGVAVALVVWVAAYGSTSRGSLRRTVIAVPAALAIGIGLVLLGSAGFALAGLAVGWGLAMPHRSPMQVVLRSLPPVAAALIMPSISGVIGYLTVALASPLTAAVWIWTVGFAFSTVFDSDPSR